jgi:hypothetical protein
MIAVLAGIADAIAYTNRCLLEAISYTKFQSITPGFQSTV